MPLLANLPMDPAPVTVDHDFSRVDQSSMITHTPANATELDSVLAGSDIGDGTPVRPGIIKLDSTIEYAYSGNGANLNGINSWSGSGPVYIISDRLDMLSEQRRISPRDYRWQGTIRCNSTTASHTCIRAGINTDQIWLVGIELFRGGGAAVTTAASIGGTLSSESDICNEWVFDRCSAHSLGNHQVQVMISPQANNLVIKHSYITDGLHTGGDGMGCQIYNCKGPILIWNNQFSGAGTCLFFGGAVPSLQTVQPNDVTIIGNLYYKKIKWLDEGWRAKNMHENKIGERYFGTGNILMWGWQDSQDGSCFVLTPTTQGGQNDWAIVRDLNWEYNRVYGADKGFQISGGSNNGPGGSPSSQQSRRWRHAHNEIILGHLRGGTSKHIHNVSKGSQAEGDRLLEDWIQHHNTMIYIESQLQSTIWFYEQTFPNTDRQDVIDNIFSHGTSGATKHADGSQSTAVDNGTDNLNWVSTNLLVGEDNNNVASDWQAPAASQHAKGATFADSMDLVGFTNWRRGDFSLAPGGQYAAGGANDAEDGTDLGPDYITLRERIAHTLDGRLDSENLPVVVDL